MNTYFLLSTAIYMCTYASPTVISCIHCKDLHDFMLQHGGDVIKFAGDALLVIFKVASRASSNTFIKTNFRRVSSISGFRDETPSNDEDCDQNINDRFYILHNSQLFDLASLRALTMNNTPCCGCGVEMTEVVSHYYARQRNSIIFTPTGKPVIQHCQCCGQPMCSSCKVSVADGRYVQASQHQYVDVCVRCFQSCQPTFFTVESYLAIVGVRCVQACVELMSKLDNTQGLRMHMGVGIGEVQFMHVGGLLDRWEFLLAGNALLQMSHAEPMSKSGEICVSRELWQLINKHCDGILVDTASEIRKITKVKSRIPIEASMRRWEMWDVPDGMKPLATPSSLEDSILRYIPGSIKKNFTERKKKGVADLNELRCVSVLFVNLPSIDYNAPDCLQLLQKSLLIMQAALYQFEGI